MWLTGVHARVESGASTLSERGSEMNSKRYECWVRDATQMAFECATLLGYDYAVSSQGGSSLTTQPRDGVALHIDFDNQSGETVLSLRALPENNLAELRYEEFWREMDHAFEASKGRVEGEEHTIDAWFDTGKAKAATLLLALGYEKPASGYSSSVLASKPRKGIALRLDLKNRKGKTGVVVRAVPQSQEGEARVKEFVGELRRV